MNKFQYFIKLYEEFSFQKCINKSCACRRIELQASQMQFEITFIKQSKKRQKLIKMFFCATTTLRARFLIYLAYSFNNLKHQFFMIMSRMRLKCTGFYGRNLPAYLGNKQQSLIESWAVTHINSRSNPRPKPPCGTLP